MFHMVCEGMIKFAIAINRCRIDVVSMWLHYQYPTEMKHCAVYSFCIWLYYSQASIHAVLSV